MKILAIETSGFEGSIALSENSDVLAQRELARAGRRHAQTLVLEVAELLESHSLQPDQIDVVAVSHGPGSFTGLRVGVVFAKTFAWPARRSWFPWTRCWLRRGDCWSRIPSSR